MTPVPDAPTEWDVVVVGAGPAGATAARVAAEAGARVLLIDAARFPRYKTCGGGLVGASLESLPPAAHDVVERRVRAVGVSLHGGRIRTIAADAPFLAMVRRDRLDAALARAATDAGAVFRDHVRVRGLDDDGRRVTISTDAGTLTARVVVGADGTSGITGRHVGVRIARTDLGLERELAADGDGDDEAWRDRAHLDWGRRPGTYGWVFPKAGRLTVGVIERRGSPETTRAYLDRFVSGLGLEGRPVERASGHLTRWRHPASPLHRGRVLVAGDAAGLLEPWTREGISYALRSGARAGAAAARAAGEGVAATGDPAAAEAALTGYSADVRRMLAPEMRAGALLLRVFERHPRLIDALYRTDAGGTAFLRFCRGSLALADVVRDPVLGPLLRLAAR